MKMGECYLYLPKRYILVFLAFLGVFNTFAMRVILSEAIVAMVNHTAVEIENNSLSSFECPSINDENSIQSHELKGVKYDWDTQTQGVILGSLYYGYVISQIPGGILARKYGAKWVFGGGVLFAAIFCLLSPVAAGWGTIAFTIVRGLQGFSEGVTLPAINFAIGIWSPKTERSRVSTIIFLGVLLGTVVAMPVAGLLCGTDFLGGWPSVFYVFGVISCIWFFFWSFLIYETPDIHPSISKGELLCIQLNTEDQSQKTSTVPWKKMLTSLPAWAVLISHTGHNFGFLIMLSEIPTYLSSVLHYDLASNGILSALPFICQALSAFVASFVADELRKSNKLSITTIRKILNCIGMFGPAICLIGITLSGCRTKLIVVLLCVAMTLNGCIFSGFNVTHVDMCPSNPATFYAITNAFSNLTGIIGPLIVGAFVANGASLSNWSKIFYTTAVMYVFGGGFYAMFASAEDQKWDNEKEDFKNDNTSKQEIRTRL